MANAISRRDFVKLSGITAAGLGGASIITACGGSSSSSSNSDSIKVGLMGPYSGDVAQYGLAVRHGAELYVKELNEAGGIGGRNVELNTQDEKGDATEAVNVYNKMAEDGVVAIIGDGAMSGGLAFEGLNNVSSQPNDLLIILNDNDMSIDRSVGGMEQYLLNLDTNETYNRLRFKASQ